jgi:hypothetical protein
MLTDVIRERFADHLKTVSGSRIRIGGLAAGMSALAVNWFSFNAGPAPSKLIDPRRLVPCG